MSINSLKNAVGNLWNILNTNKDGVIDNNDNIDEAIKNELGINNSKTYTYDDIEQNFDNILNTVYNNTQKKYLKGEITEEEYNKIKGISAELPESQYYNIYNKNINWNLNNLSEFKTKWAEKKQACSNEEELQQCEADFNSAKQDLIAKENKKLEQHSYIINSLENRIIFIEEQKEDYTKKYPGEYIDTLIQGFDKLIINLKTDYDSERGINDEITDYLELIKNIQFSDL